MSKTISVAHEVISCQLFFLWSEHGYEFFKKYLSTAGRSKFKIEKKLEDFFWPFINWDNKKIQKSKIRVSIDSPTTSSLQYLFDWS